jgi:hypothetical protein
MTPRQASASTPCRGSCASSNVVRGRKGHRMKKLILTGLGLVAFSLPPWQPTSRFHIRHRLHRSLRRQFSAGPAFMSAPLLVGLVPKTRAWQCHFRLPRECCLSTNFHDLYPRPKLARYGTRKDRFSFIAGSPLVWHWRPCLWASKVRNDCRVFVRN